MKITIEVDGKGIKKVGKKIVKPVKENAGPIAELIGYYALASFLLLMSFMGFTLGDGGAWFMSILLGGVGLFCLYCALTLSQPQRYQRYKKVRKEKQSNDKPKQDIEDDEEWRKDPRFR
jgi:hypothetical protein